MGQEKRKDGTPPAGPKAGRNPRSIAELVADPENRRRRTARGQKMLADSMAQVGAARSIVIDEDNAVLAGGGALEAAAVAGITKLKVVDADGQTVIAVRRRGLTPEAKRALAIYDNRTGELAEWNGDQLASDAAAGLTLSPWFDERELAKLTKKTEVREATVAEVPTGDVQDQFW